MALIFDRAHRRIDLQRLVETLIVDTSEIAKEVPCPYATITPVRRKPAVHAHGGKLRQCDQAAFPTQRLEIRVILHAQQAILLGALILAHQRLVAAT